MHRRARGGATGRPWRLVIGRVCAALILPLALAACQEMGIEAAAPRMAPGVPIAVQAALTQAFTNAAAQHKITLVEDTQSPRFRLKGYLTATPIADGRTSLDY